MTKQIQIEKLVRGTNIREEEDTEVMELAESIRTNGLLNPLTVVRRGSKYAVVAGHRRFLALQILQEPWVECNVLEYEPTEKDILCIQLQENCCRKNMSAWEFVDLFKRLEKQGMTQYQIAQMCGKSQPWVNMQYAAAATLERCGEVNADTKKLTAARIRNIYGKVRVTDDRTRTEVPHGVHIQKKGSLFSIRCISKEAEKELVAFLEGFRKKYQ
jgi:ParB/RepB/Spo0J family partition protein